jgi:hypothetical protein
MTAAIERKLAQKVHELEELDQSTRGPASPRYSAEEAARERTRAADAPRRSELLGWIRALEWALRQSALTVTDTPPTRENTGQDTAPL